jgi:hypothetical protein
MKGYTIDNGVIVINREFTELDLFVKSFIDILKKHANYLIVSGFVSISTGRTRGTEDIDILVPLLPREKFSALFKDITDNGFWCYQSDSADEAYTYLQGMSSIRFARANEMFPNIEFIPVTEARKAKFYELNHPQKIKVDGLEFNIPPIEFEILYKEIVLAGKKDIEDARHLRAFFKDIIKESKFKEYETIIRSESR